KRVEMLNSRHAFEDRPALTDLDQCEVHALGNPWCGIFACNHSAQRFQTAERGHVCVRDRADAKACHMTGKECEWLPAACSPLPGDERCLRRAARKPRRASGSSSPRGS